MNTQKQPEGVSEIFSWIGTRLKSLFVKAEPAVVALVRRLWNDFEGVALEAVAAEATKVISGQEKFSNAVANVKAAIVAQGWQVRDSLIQTLVQDTYTAWKLNQKPVEGELLIKAPN